MIMEERTDYTVSAVADEHTQHNKRAANKGGRSV